jgi:hypothetical protein
METGSLLQSPEIKITKLNETPNLTSRVVVTGSGGTPGFISSGVEVDSHGTISYLWDTNAIAAISAEDNLGSTRFKPSLPSSTQPSTAPSLS